MGMEGWWAVANSLGETIAWFRSRADAEDYRKYLAAPLTARGQSSGFSGYGGLR